MAEPKLEKEPLKSAEFEAYLSGEKHPETAEQLMRSRYMAYASANVDYIVETHDPKTRHEIDQEGALTWAKESDWRGLTIVRVNEGGKDDLEGIVEFIATYAVQDVEYEHHEIAIFRKSNDRWYFVDGTLVKPKPIRRTAPKVGRNEPCPCGSGKKFKRCCGKN